MAAEKLTIARCIQILVVMAILILAFIWRTIDYTANKNVFTCILDEGVCTVAAEGRSVSINILNQEDGRLFLSVSSLIKPHYVRLGSDVKNTIPLLSEGLNGNAVMTYIYALPKKVRLDANDTFTLFIEPDLIEIHP